MAESRNGDYSCWYIRNLRSSHWATVTDQFAKYCLFNNYHAYCYWHFISVRNWLKNIWDSFYVAGGHTFRMHFDEFPLQRCRPCEFINRIHTIFTKLEDIYRSSWIYHNASEYFFACIAGSNLSTFGLTQKTFHPNF